MDATGDGVGEVGDGCFGQVDVRVWLFVARDGECGAKETGRRIESWNLAGERVVRGGAAIGGHECNIADPSWVVIRFDFPGQDGRAMWNVIYVTRTASQWCASFWAT